MAFPFCSRPVRKISSTFPSLRTSPRHRPPFPSLIRMVSPRTFFHRLPFRFHWALVILMGAVIPLITRKTAKPGEFYPFSNFPMYSSFEPNTYLVFITDLEDKPLPISTVFATSASDIKKIYDRKLGELKPRAPKGTRKVNLPAPLKKEAADATLTALVKRISPSPSLAGKPGLRLHQVDILYDGDQLTQRTTQVGEISLP
jgi:hypothetical protein